MANYTNFHTKLASIMEVLANAAVAEICQLVDDGYANLRLEISRAQRENLALKSKLRLMEVRSRERCGKSVRVPPQLVVTCTRKDHYFGDEENIILKRKTTGNMKNLDSQMSRQSVMSESIVDSDVVVVKAERLEDELSGCSVQEDHQMAPSCSIGHQCLSLRADNDHLLASEASVTSNNTEVPGIHFSGRYERDDLAETGAPLQQAQEQGDPDSLTTRQDTNGYSSCGRHLQQPEPNQGSVHRSSGLDRTKEVTEMLPSRTPESKGMADVDEPCGVFSVGAATESSGFKPLNAGCPLAKAMNTDLPMMEAAATGLCSTATAWKGDAEEGSTAVKMEAEMQLSWFEERSSGTGLSLVPVPKPDREESQLNSSDLLASDDCRTNNGNNPSGHIHPKDSQSGESTSTDLDPAGLDSTSFDDLFSSPEVARSLIVPQRDSIDTGGGGEERLSSFPFVSSGFGSPSSLNSLSDGYLRNLPSESSRGRAPLTGPARVFCCQQCGRLFSNSRDLVVHQRSHAGERLFYCPVCKKPFLHLHQLKTHQRVHTGEKPFSCTQCGKRFSQSSHIKRHMSVHTGEKRYSCGLCGKRFSQSCSLKVHQAVHTGERPYSCTQCGKSFSVLGNLVRHQSVHIRK